MTLLTINEIQDGLDNEFLPLEPMLSGFRLIRTSLQEQSITACEEVLSVNFPSSFRNTISTLEFGKLTIGPVFFCNTGDYLAELINLNKQVHWWGDGQKPQNLLLIANSDPFAILLDTENGAILAMDSEIGWQKSGKISRNFDDFLRGIGTVFLCRNSTPNKEELAQTVCSEVGGEGLFFWKGLSK